MNAPLDPESLLPGLADPVFDSQVAFRAALDAFSHPGRAVRIPLAPRAPAPLMSATAALMLALLDFETTLWLQERNAELVEYMRFHCGVRLVSDARESRFALVTDPATLPDLSQFTVGNAEYPDRSTTLLIQVKTANEEQSVRLSGPGIRGETRLAIAGLRSGFWSQWQRNHALFPCGVDAVFICNDVLFALPRTVKAEV